MPTSTIFDCPIDGCDSLPWTDPESLAEHIAEHFMPAPAAAPAAPSAPVAPAAAAPVLRSFSPGGTRTPFAPTADPAPVKVAPDAELPPCKWRKVGDDWHVSGPMSVLSGATTVEVRKASGERKQVDIDPASVTKSARRSGDVCPMGTARPAPKAKAAPAMPLEHGRVYADADGTFIKVVESKSGSLYGKLLDDEHRFTIYQGGLLNRIARQLTAEEAAAFGHLHKRCVFCARKLSDDKSGRSVEVGYGSTCADKYGLPWG